MFEIFSSTVPEPLVAPLQPPSNGDSMRLPSEKSIKLFRQIKVLSSQKQQCPHHKWIRTIKKPKLFLPLTRNNAIRNRSQLWRNWSGPRYTSLPVYYFNWGIFTILKHFRSKSHWNSVGGPSFTFLDGREQCLYRHTSNRCHKTQFNFIVVHRFFAPFGFAAKVKKKRMAFQKQLCSKVCLFHFLLSK